MIPSSNTLRLSVQSIGEAARDILKSHSKGRILAVFSNAVYLDSINNGLLWLVNEKIPMHRRGIQIPGTLPRLAANSSFNVRGQHLLLGTDTDLDMSLASLWEYPCPDLDNVLPFEELPKRLRAVSSLFDGCPSPKGFGQIFSEITKLGLGSPWPAEIHDYGPTLKHTWPALNEIVLASIAKDYPRILRTAEDLIGLGEGLTPSGDDFVGGLLFSSFMIQKIYTQYQGFSLPDVELFLINSRDRTNLISYTILEDLALGHGSDILHRFMNAILTDKHLENTHYLGLELVRIGHSTGWDLLTGVWMGMFLSTCSREAFSASVPAFTSCRH